MKFVETPLGGAFVVTPEPFKDDRGFFARVFCKNEFKEIGLDVGFVQINHSKNNKAGTLRGIHYQNPPFSENKLVRCIHGSAFDVIVDIRKGSSTFLKHFHIELSSENMKMLFIPEGFAHGFITLAQNTEILYHHTSFYAPGYEAAIKYDDPALDIQWPMPPKVISERDKNHSFITNQFKGI